MGELDADIVETVRQSKIEELEATAQTVSDVFRELLDRVFLMASNWEYFIMDHESCFRDKELFHEAARIQGEIMDFYQKVGNK
jgi:hypothetical protein